MMQSRLSQPPMTSPAWILMRSFRGMLISSSTVQGLLTCPLMLNSLVPLFLVRPKLANQSPPRLQIVGATATVSTLDEQVEVVASAAGFLAKEPSLVGLPDSDLEVAGLVVELSSDVDVSGPSPHGAASHETALHESVRVVPHDLTVLAGAGLALVSVDHEVLGSAVTRLVHEGPLHAGREASA